jgi:hypothetical protein
MSVCPLLCVGMLARIRGHRHAGELRLESEGSWSVSSCECVEDGRAVESTLMRKGLRTPIGPPRDRGPFFLSIPLAEPPKISYLCHHPVIPQCRPSHIPGSGPTSRLDPLPDAAQCPASPNTPPLNRGTLSRKVTDNLARATQQSWSPPRTPG